MKLVDPQSQKEQQEEADQQLTGFGPTQEEEEGQAPRSQTQELQKQLGI